MQCVMCILESKFCQAPGPGLDQPGPWPGQPGHQPGLTKPWPTSSPNWSNLALTLTKTGPGVDTIIKQTTTTTTTKLFKSENLEFLLSDCSESQRGELDWHYNQTGPPPPSSRKRGGETTFAKKASNDLKCILDHGFHFLANPPPWQDECGGEGSG